MLLAVSVQIDEIQKPIRAPFEAIASIDEIKKEIMITTICGDLFAIFPNQLEFEKSVNLKMFYANEIARNLPFRQKKNW